VRDPQGNCKSGPEIRNYEDLQCTGSRGWSTRNRRLFIKSGSLLQLRTDDWFKQNKTLSDIRRCRWSSHHEQDQQEQIMIRSNYCACPPLAYFSGSKYDGWIWTNSWDRLRTQCCEDRIWHQSWKNILCRATRILDDIEGLEDSKQAVVIRECCMNLLTRDPAWSVA